MPLQHVVYILYSPTADRHYIGQSSDFAKRTQEHLAGHTHSTRHVSDWQILFLEKVADRSAAMALECKIKRMKSRKSIARYVADPRNHIKHPVPLDEWMGESQSH
jgi:putative endonuclease